MDWTHGKDPGLEALACFDGLRAFRASFVGFYDRCQARAEGQCLLDCRPYFTIHWSPKNGLWVYRKLGAEFFESGPKKLRKYFYLFQDLLFGDRLHALVVAYWDMLSISREVPELIDEGGMARVLYLLMSEAKGIFDLDLTTDFNRDISNLDNTSNELDSYAFFTFRLTLLLIHFINNRRYTNNFIKFNRYTNSTILSYTYQKLRGSHEPNLIDISNSYSSGLRDLSGNERYDILDRWYYTYPDAFQYLTVNNN